MKCKNCGREREWHHFGKCNDEVYCITDTLFEPEDEWEEWERDKTTNTAIVFKPTFTSYSLWTHNDCINEIRSFGGFVFRTEGEPDLLSLHPIMWCNEESGNPISSPFGCKGRKVVYADAVRMRKV